MLKWNCGQMCYPCRVEGIYATTVCGSAKYRFDRPGVCERHVVAAGVEMLVELNMYKGVIWGFATLNSCRGSVTTLQRSEPQPQRSYLQEVTLFATSLAMDFSGFTPYSARREVEDGGAEDVPVLVTECRLTTTQAFPASSGYRI
jgi:hypothetical protein